MSTVDREKHDETSAVGVKSRKKDRSAAGAGIFRLVVFGLIGFWLVAGRIGYRTLSCSVVSAGVTTVGQYRSPAVVIRTRECGDVRYAYDMSKQRAHELAEEYGAASTCRVKVFWLDRWTPGWWGEKPLRTEPDCS